MSKQDPFKYFKTSPEIIRLAVMYYVRYPLSHRQVEDILHERGIDICHETVRYWVERFGLLFSNNIRHKRRSLHSNWQWHLDDVFVKINGERFYLWRAVDHEGEVLESTVTKRRDKQSALKFLFKAMKKYGVPNKIVTDKLRSNGAALKQIGALPLQDSTQYLNNRSENSHLPFRRREQAMLKFRSPATLQSFISIHSQFYKHFNHQRHLQKRNTYKQLRSVALNKWRQICVC